MNCIKCGAQLDDGVNFCKFCGQNQQESPVTEAPVSETPATEVPSQPSTIVPKTQSTSEAMADIAKGVGSQISDKTKVLGEKIKSIDTTEITSKAKDIGGDISNKAKDLGGKVKNIDADEVKTNVKNFKFTKKTAIALAGVVAFIFIIVGIASLFTSDAATISKAILNTSSSISSEIEDMSKELPILSFFSDIEDEQYSFELEDKYGYEYALYSDIKDSKMLFIGNVMGAEFSTTLSKNAITFAVDDIFDDVYGISFKDLEDNLEDTDLVDIELPAKFNSDIFDLKDQLTKELSVFTEDLISDIIMAFEVEKLDDESMKINKQSITAKTYSVTLDEDDLEDILTAAVEDLFKNEDFVSAISTYGFLAYGIDDSDDIEDEFYDMIDEIINSYESIADSDILFYVYKNRLVAISVENSYPEISITFNPTGNVLDYICIDSNGLETTFETTFEDDEFVFEYNSESGYTKSFTIEYDVSKTKNNLTIEEETYWGTDELTLSVDASTKNELEIKADDYTLVTSKTSFAKTWFDQEDDFEEILLLDDDDDLFSLLYYLF